jgi:predicted permease
MRRLRASVLRFVGLFDKRRRDLRLTDELQSHLEMHIEDNLRAGMTPDQARRQALMALGGLDQTKEQYRDRRGIPFLEAIVQDLRYALRTMRKSPGFTGAAVLTLALGIGANTAMFSFADATAFRPMDVPRPGEVIRIFSSTKADPYGQLSVPDYRDFRSHTTTLSGLVAYETNVVAMSKSQDENPRMLLAYLVSGNYFSALDLEPAIGRGFRDEEDRVAGANAVVVISDGLWRREFQADPAVVGKTITLASHEFTIIGVAPAGFSGTDLFVHPDLFVPLAMTHEVAPVLPTNYLDDRANRDLDVVGRLKPGVSVARANAEVVALARSIEQSNPDSNRNRTAMALPEMAAREKLDEGGYQSAGLFLGIVAMVLLIACANVANLMLSRAAGRAREIAVRLAIGASRGRLVRQLLTESVLVAAVGGLVGLVLAYGGTRYLSLAAQSILSNSDFPIAVDFRLDERVLLFTLATILATAVLFGLTPALRSTRINLALSLTAATKTAGGRRRWFSARNLLVASQVALSVVVLTVSGLSIRSFLDKRQADPGFRTDHVLLMTFDPGAAGQDRDQVKQFYDRVVARTKVLPGVTAAALAQGIPLSGINTGQTTALVVDGFEMPVGQDSLSVRSNIVDPGYWNAMRIPIVRGRAFDDRDTTASPQVIVINETMARQYWPNQDAVGNTIHFGARNGPEVQVIGVAKDGKYNDIAEHQQPVVYLPFSQANRSMMTMIVLAKSDAADLSAPIRSEVKALDVNVPVFNVRTLDSVYEARTMVPARLVSQIMVSLGVLGLVLAVVGLYGVISYLTTLRTREIGIRMAIGADRLSVLLLVLKQSVGMVGVGLVVGIGLAFFLTPALAVPFDFVPRDLTILTIVPFVLSTAALTASLIPARRAAMVSPTVALRDE